MKNNAPPGMQPEICNRGAVLGIWGQSPQPLEAIGGLGDESPALQKFEFFFAKLLDLGLFW